MESNRNELPVICIDSVTREWPTRHPVSVEAVIKRVLATVRACHEPWWNAAEVGYSVIYTEEGHIGWQLYGSCGEVLRERWFKLFDSDNQPINVREYMDRKYGHDCTIADFPELKVFEWLEDRDDIVVVDTLEKLAWNSGMDGVNPEDDYKAFINNKLKVRTAPNVISDNT